LVIACPSFFLNLAIARATSSGLFRFARLANAIRFFLTAIIVFSALPFLSRDNSKACIVGIVSSCWAGSSVRIRKSVDEGSKSVSLDRAPAS
jgi:hypothetical protein